MSTPYNPNTQGWGFALVVCAITAGLFGWAYSVHNATYLHPRNPMFQQVYHERDAGGEGHGGGSHAKDAHGDDDHGAEGGTDH